MTKTTTEHLLKCKALRKLLCFLVVILFNFSFAQKESAFWYFGIKAGINFSETGVQTVLDGELSTNEGCATISNNNGDLLFYTDGITVWNRNHQVMPNGTGLLGHPSSTQSAIIVPKPNSNSVYYIFTVTNVGNPDGLRYSEVDLNLNNGLGDITSNKNIPLFTPSTEKITAVHHANGKDFWVISHAWESNEFLVFSVTENGVNIQPIVTPIGSYHGGHSYNSHGYMKVSPNGKKLAVAKWYSDSFVELFDFDSRTGAISNPITIDGVFDNDGQSGAYGLEFSPDGNLLYVSDLKMARYSSKLHQFDLSINTKDAILNSDTLIYSGNNLLSALQLALDGKIYISNSLTSYLDVIEHPNIRGIGCQHKNKEIYLGGRLTIFGLPPFIQSFFIGTIEAENVCLGNETNFILEINQPIDQINWDFGDGNSATTTESSFNYTYELPGIYEVNATILSGYNTYHLNKTVEVYNNPKIDVNTDWFLCNKEPLTLYLNSSHDGYLWSNGETTSTIEINQSGLYHVTAFNNTSNPDVICEDFVEIQVVESGIATISDVEINDWTANSNSIRVAVEGVGDYEYSLDDLRYQDSNEFNDLRPGDYTIYVRDKNGCGIAEKEVYIMNYPKYFTPNGDGYNDTWKITASEMEPNMSIQIFDRYGKLIKQISPTSHGWDGSYNGYQFPTSDYWFVVNRPEKNKQYKGHFTLKR
ncbi:T9SS type B sorting domain-containing protein [Tamlana flava]|uniref:T9SS type B sorting domain-containing protein n=1 Tax=Tamlana flava TaxID=3158572 RepID=UPI00351B6FD1